MAKRTIGAAIAGLALAAVTATGAQAHEPKQTIMPEDAEARAFQEAVGYSDAVIHGDVVILSGVVAVPQAGDEGMEPSFVRVFDQIGRTLERAGIGWDDVIEVETFHTDLAGQINAFADVKNRYIKAPFPAWTAIGISALYEPAGLVEVKITARRADQ
ncbi:Rid family hydrolase [Qipengyuania zhejiangensis]|uniref:Rid family hydrolase n=1 Tax=Qipengyuania zhejiangensis TaxID=3077782 RepID=UPI002D7954B1|nr:Rid family hydrolase [Qipengyuania sp. Z2]